MRRFPTLLGWLLASLVAATLQSALARDPAAEISLSAYCERRPVSCLDYRHANHANCGSRGGPGCRKPDGRCAAWREGYTPACFALRGRSG